MQLVDVGKKRFSITVIHFVMRMAVKYSSELCRPPASGDFGHEHQFCVLCLDADLDILSVVQIVLLCSCRVGNFMPV